MSESTQTGTVDTVQNNNTSRTKAAFIVGGTLVLFLVGAVAFQFLRPKVGPPRKMFPTRLERTAGPAPRVRPSLE